LVNANANKRDFLRRERESHDGIAHLVPMSRDAKDLGREALLRSEHGGLVALEKAKTEKEAHGEFESEHPGYCGAQDTFYVGKIKYSRHGKT
jgi:hypothetical protein